MRGNVDAMTLNDFLNHLMLLDPQHISVRSIWQFEGGWVAGHTMCPEDFPKVQPLGFWNVAWDEWQKVMKEVAA